MDKSQLQKMLRELAFSEHLPEAVLEKLATAAVVGDYTAGTVLFREGSENRIMFLIYSGSVVLEMCVPARGCVRLMTVGSGDVLAWSAVLGDGQMTATATCATEVRTIEIAAEVLQEICERHHDIGYVFMREMAKAISQRLVATRLQLMDVYSNEFPAGSRTV